MSRLNTAINNDVKLLRLLRDEVLLQAHLLKADAKDAWADLEQKWQQLQVKFDRAGIAAEDACEDADEAAIELVASLRSGYERIKNDLKS